MTDGRNDVRWAMRAMGIMAMVIVGMTFYGHFYTVLGNWLWALVVSAGSVTAIVFVLYVVYDFGYNQGRSSH